MKRSSLLLSTLVLGSPVFAAWTLPVAAERVVFSPAAGSTVVKTFTTKAEMQLEDMSMLMNGQDAPFGGMDMTMTTLQTVKVTDTYEAVADGKPTKLRRTFDEVGTEMQMEMSMEVMGQTQEQSPSGNGSSPLEGKTVVFQAGEDGYAATFAEGEEGDAELLEGVTEDMDLRSLLPPSGSAAVGDSWDIELHGLIDILAPGGDLKLDVEMDGQMMGGAGMDPGMMSHMREFFGEMLEGSAKGTLTEVRQVGDARVAVIDLAVEIDASADMSELMLEQMDEQMPDGMEISLDRADVEFALEAKGQLLWNLTANRVQSLDLEGDSSMATDMEMNMDMGGQAMDMEMSMEMSGKMTIGVATE